MPTAPPERFLNISEAAAYLGVSKRTMHRRIQDGSLAPTRVGKRMFRFDPAQLAAMVSVNTTDTDPLAEHVAAVVAAAPELTTEQRDKLAGLLRSTAGSDSR